MKDQSKALADLRESAANASEAVSFLAKYAPAAMPVLLTGFVLWNAKPTMEINSTADRFGGLRIAEYSEGDDIGLVMLFRTLADARAFVVELGIGNGWVASDRTTWTDYPIS